MDVPTGESRGAEHYDRERLAALLPDLAIL